MAKFPRKELDKMMQRWLEANRLAEAEGDWSKHLGPLYTEDAEYRWNVGPNEEFVAEGRQQIEDWALGVQMEGFAGWSYPYDKVLIDQTQGEVVCFWRQIAPWKRPDGSDYEVAGLGGSWFRYGGDFKWEWQRDFFDLGNVFALLAELAADGHLAPEVKAKIHRMAKGQALAGHRPLRAKPNALRKAKMGAAMAKAALLGR